MGISEDEIRAALSETGISAARFNPWEALRVLMSLLDHERYLRISNAPTVIQMQFDSDRTKNLSSMLIRTHARKKQSLVSAALNGAEKIERHLLRNPHAMQGSALKIMKDELALAITEEKNT
jgi:hypothetical protein